MSGYHDTYGGLVIDRDRCAYCEAWPDLPCALHRNHADPRADRVADGGEG